MFSSTQVFLKGLLDALLILLGDSQGAPLDLSYAPCDFGGGSNYKLILKPVIYANYKKDNINNIF
mgnify:CR=1 FL=1|jgi:hypothetical protein